MAEDTMFSNENINKMVNEVMEDTEYENLIDEIGQLTEYEKDCVIAFILGLTMKNALILRKS